MKNVTLLVEEIDSFSSSELEHLIEHMRRGRHNENNFIGVSRHPTEIDDELRKHSDVIVSFQQDDVNVLNYLSRINSEAAKELPLLKRGEVKVLTGLEFLEEFYNRNQKQHKEKNDADNK
jgi:hypothetical protein